MTRQQTEGLKKLKQAFFKDLPKEKQNLETPKKDYVGLKTIPLESIQLSENTRKSEIESDDSFHELVDSITKRGVLQPVLLSLSEGEGGKHSLVCVEGHRRVLAAKKAGKNSIPALIKKYDNHMEKTVDALFSDAKLSLHALDKADAFADFLEAGNSQEWIAAQFKIDIKTVKRYLKLSYIQPDVKELIRKHKDIFTTRFLMQKIAQKNLTEAEIENIVNNKIEKPSSEKKPQGSEERELKKSLNSAFGGIGIKLTSMRTSDDKMSITLKGSLEELKKLEEYLKAK